MAFEQLDLTPARPNKDYVFVNTFPHPTDPITDETFHTLDTAIEAVIIGLGISDDLDRYPRSCKGNREPELSVLRKLGPDGLIRLGGMVVESETTTYYTLRNDAGTIEEPAQNAGTMRVVRNKLFIQERWTDSVSNTEASAWLRLIQKHAATRSFKPAQRVTYL